MNQEMLSCYMQDRVRQSRQFVTDHAAYDEVYDSCQKWCEDIATRLEPCLLTTGKDRAVVEMQLNRLRELMEQSNAGSRRLQRVHDASVAVLATTSPAGGELIGQSLAQLVAFWEQTVANMALAKNQLTDSLAQFDEHEMMAARVGQLLREADEEFCRISGLQSSLAEKKAQRDSMKVIAYH